MTAMRGTLLLLLSAAALSTTAANKTRVSTEFDPCAAVDCASGLVCTLVTPQSCNVAPCPKMPVCLPKNQTCDTNSCKADETCVLRSVTCIMAPCYPVKECAKLPKCGANEEYNECSLNGPCEPNCKEAFPICSNVTCGSGACECKTGYYRHNGACITRDQCPTPTCEKPNEVWSTCPSACPQTCRILRGKEEQMMCPAVCGTPQCTCATGYVRDDDWNCVKADDCPKEFACDSPHEEFVNCSTHCEPTCDNRTPTCIESCGPAKCQCKKDYVRHEGSCLFALQCPMEGNSTDPSRPIPDDDDASASGEDSGENSGEKGPSCDGVRCAGNTACSLRGGRAVCKKCKKHEKIDPCPNACAQGTCEDGGIMRKCAAIKMCGPQACVCADGYVRNMRSGECVKREKCPKADNSTMHILPMPANWTRPLILPFPESDNGTMHIMPHIDPIPTNWTRPAPRPFFPPGTNGSDGTMHILPFFPPKDEEVHIMPVDELVDPIPRNWTRPAPRPAKPGTNGTDGTMHIMPVVDPIPSNWTRPMRPQVLPIFVKENNTVHFANGTIISVPYVPFNGTSNENMHIMPIGRPQTMPFLPGNSSRPQPRPAVQNGTMNIMPHFEGSAHILPFLPRGGGDAGSVHIMTVGENGTMISRPYVPRFNDNGTDMHIMPFEELVDPIPRNWSRPAPRPFFPPKDGAVHIMPVDELVDPIPRNWTRPAPRPAKPGTNGTDGTMHIMPVVDPIPRNGTRPQILPIFANWTKPLIRPAFPDNSTDGTAHILPILSDPIPANWTRPAPRPHAGNDTMISGPYVPHFRENGTMNILPFFPAGNDSVSGGNGAVHIMPYVPSNSTADVCANHTCPAGHWCEETPVMCINIAGPCPPIATCVSTSARGAGGGARDQPSCGKHEEYSNCAPACPETCRGVSDCAGKVQPLVCKAGCVCKDKFKRDRHGVCVPNHKCWKTAGCQANEIWHKCRPCEPTCTDSKEICSAQCVSGCGCDHGFVRGPTGACIEQKKCPKNTATTTKASGSTVTGTTTTARSPSTTTSHKA